MKAPHGPGDRHRGGLSAFRGFYPVRMDWVPLLDVTDVSVAELVASTSPIVARCVERIVAGLDDPDGIISAFQSYVE